MKHLDAQRWQELLARRPADPELLTHVQEGCEVCDAFLASVPGLDGEVDRALLSLAPRAASTDELAWARLRRRQRAAPRVMAFAAAAVAVLGAIGAWAMLPAREARPTGLKGSGSAHVELRAALQSADGALTPVEEGASVSASAALVFQVRSGLAGPARLFVQRGAGEPVELAQVGLVEGAQELERDGEGLLGLSLRGERGSIQVWLVAAETPTSADQALAAIRAGGGENLAVAHVRVDVAP